MKNKEKTELIPELRFGVFPIKNWDEKKLQDIFIYLSTNTYSRNLLNNRQGIYQNIHYGDILVKYGSIIDAQKEEIPYINEDIECTTDNIIMDGDIIIADTAEDEIVGKTSEIFNIGDKKILSGLHTFWLRPLISFAPKYLGYFFNSTQYHNQLLPLIQGAKVSSISKKALNNTIIVYPSTSEQQKIADCLSSLDDLIEATAQKVDALKEHKKGLMQRLFPAEGKNVPDLRFPEFQGAKEWKECSLDEYFDFKQGFQCPIEEQYDKQELGMVRFIRIIDLTQPSTPYRYINDPGNQYYINRENLFMVRYGDPGLVGIGYEGIIANNLFQLIPKKKINPYFFYFLFSKEKTRIKGLSSSTSLSAINFTSLKALKIVVSQNTDEQQKIANCLFSLDELIEATSRKVEILKEHKKGLMQQLFPKI